MSLVISSEYIFHSTRPTESPFVEKVTLPVTTAVLDDVTSLSLTEATSKKKLCLLIQGQRSRAISF